MAPRCQGAQRMATMPDALGCRRSRPACAGDCWVQKKGRKEKVIDVEEDEDVAAEEQELDSVEEVGRLTIGDRL